MENDGRTAIVGCPVGCQIVRLALRSRMKYDTSGDDDPIRWFSRAIVDRIPQADPRQVRMIEIAARVQWGGRRPYVRQRDRVERATGDSNDAG